MADELSIIGGPDILDLAVAAVSYGDKGEITFTVQRQEGGRPYIFTVHSTRKESDGYHLEGVISRWVEVPVMHAGQSHAEAARKARVRYECSTKTGTVTFVE